MSDINLIIKDRDGNSHKITAPTDMSMNIMEIIQPPLLPLQTIGFIVIDLQGIGFKQKKMGSLILLMDLLLKDQELNKTIRL